VADIIGINDFDILFYKNYYPDLFHLSCNELIQHYKNFGINEGRMYSNKQFAESLGEIDFDPFFYRYYYPDLRKIPFNELYQHFLICGKKEGRLCYNKNDISHYS
jgi:hypothetical protein